MKTVTIEVKEVYGKPTYYPVGTDALGFCKLLNQKTLTQENLRLIKKFLGYEIVIHNNYKISL